jgi:hypothetical protein
MDTVLVDCAIGLIIGLGTCFLCTSAMTRRLRLGSGVLSFLLTRPTLVGASIGLIASLIFLCSPANVAYHTFVGAFIGYIVRQTMHLWSIER